jgi:hypothetical protein
MIHTADETSLLCPAKPDRSISRKLAILSGSKRALDLVTVLCCSNMSGTEKRKMLVVGRRAKPQYFNEISVDSLPVLYYVTINAWMTASVV